MHAANELVVVFITFCTIFELFIAHLILSTLIYSVLHSIRPYFYNFLTKSTSNLQSNNTLAAAYCQIYIIMIKFEYYT